jgi:phage tail-like protein
MSENRRIAMMEQSRLLQYLPDIYHARKLTRDLLRIYEDIWAPLEQQLDCLPAYFDPRLAPAEFLPWLGTWVDLVLDANIAEKRQRELLGKAVWLYQRRGTALALREHLRISLDINLDTNPKAIMISNMPDEYKFHVTITPPRASTSDERAQLKERAHRIIQAEKPAHTTYILEIS